MLHNIAHEGNLQKDKSSMTSKDLSDFLAELNQYNNKNDKLAYAKQFHDKMIRKYGNQFEQNGIIEEFLNVLSSLESNQ